MDDLLSRFLPQFVKLARERIEAVITAAKQRDGELVKKAVRELHTLVGEAGLLGLSQVAGFARECENKAKQLQATHGEADAVGLIDALAELSRMIETVGGAATTS
jgi:HPt (histidine-containing phosphotransfer) domain-containing protein